MKPPGVGVVLTFGRGQQVNRKEGRGARQLRSTHRMNTEKLKTDRVTVRFVDGKEIALPIHGIRQLQVYGILDELGIKSFSELTRSDEESSLASFRTMIRMVAIALTFSKQKTWTAERIQETFADPNEILKAFNKCMELSDIPKAPDATIMKSSKHGPYG
jgi:hypothetical protein